jgi:hypothetical protein
MSIERPHGSGTEVCLRHFRIGGPSGAGHLEHHGSLRVPTDRPMGVGRRLQHRPIDRGRGLASPAAVRWRQPTSAAPGMTAGRFPDVVLCNRRVSGRPETSLQAAGADGAFAKTDTPVGPAPSRPGSAQSRRPSTAGDARPSTSETLAPYPRRMVNGESSASGHGTGAHQRSWPLARSRRRG